MTKIDKRGHFYLGRKYDLQAGSVTDEEVLYPSKHLTTHAVLLGMTGSGKTGLGIIMLEEALLQGIPVLAVDPKGDLANLLLTFPNLAPADFEPWVDAERAEREGQSIQDAAAQAAQLWSEGLSKWGVDSERIARLKRAADFTLFTPGSSAGEPVNVLHRFQTPDLDWEMYEEVMRERIEGLVTALLSLAGREADPLQSPEHVLLSHIVEHVWRAGDPLTLPLLIQMIQEPPVRQIGVFDLESFMPGKDRVALARALNNIFAAPGFESWREGVPLEVENLLYTPEGRPRANIFYLPHLDDSSRYFFITLLLEAVVDWMATQPGTSSLRAILYFDEVFGYFPPHPANPPTKEPLLSLIKRGRAAGLGVIISTQNPADLDYKGLTNAGTWAIGTLRTERDKDRVLEGLEGAASEAGAGLDRSSLDRALGSLKSRVFLLHDIRADAPVFFHTRWAMSYLCGPLTRPQLRQLDQGKDAAEELPKPAAVPAAEKVSTAKAAAAKPLSVRPTLPAGISQVFVPASMTFEWALHHHEEQTGSKVLVQSKEMIYMPRLLAMGTVYLEDEKKGVRSKEELARLFDPDPPPAPADWLEGEVGLSAQNLAQEPVGEGVFASPESHLTKASNYAAWSKSFSEYLYRNVRIPLWHNPALKLYGNVGESRRDFRVRCEQQVRAGRDEEAGTARAKVEKQIKQMQTKLRKEERELAKDQAESEERKREQLMSYGESALNLLTGRRPSYMISNVSRKRRMARQAEADVEESLEAIDDLEAQLEDLSDDWAEQAQEISARWADKLEQIEQIEIAPRRKDVVVDYCGLAWVPAWKVQTKEGDSVVFLACDLSSAAGGEG